MPLAASVALRFFEDFTLDAFHQGAAFGVNGGESCFSILFCFLGFTERFPNFFDKDRFSFKRRLNFYKLLLFLWGDRKLSQAESSSPSSLERTLAHPPGTSLFLTPWETF
jgi:hypothetical protein